MQRLPAVFTPEVAMSLSDEVIKGIAAETEETKAERSSCEKKLEILQKTMTVLRRLERHNPKRKPCSDLLEARILTLIALEFMEDAEAMEEEEDMGDGDSMQTGQSDSQ